MFLLKLKTCFYVFFYSQINVFNISLWNIRRGQVHTARYRRWSRRWRRSTIDDVVCQCAAEEPALSSVRCRLPVLSQSPATSRVITTSQHLTTDSLISLLYLHQQQQEQTQQLNAIQTYFSYVQSLNPLSSVLTCLSMEISNFFFFFFLLCFVNWCKMCAVMPVSANGLGISLGFTRF